MNVETFLEIMGFWMKLLENMEILIYGVYLCKSLISFL